MAKNLVRNGLLLGIGAAAIASELAKMHVNRLVKRHRITAKEGKKLVNSLLGKAKTLQKDVVKLATSKVSGVSRNIRQARQALMAVDNSLVLLEKSLKKLRK